MVAKVGKKTGPGSGLRDADGSGVQSAAPAGGAVGTGARRGAGPAQPARDGIDGRIAAYARVSTELQEREETVNSQLAAIRTAVPGLSDDHLYVDEGFSGSTLIRPALDRLRDRVAEGCYDSVRVYDPDRLARKYVYQMLLLEEFEANGCRLDFVLRPIGKSPDEQLLLQMQGVIAEYERAKIRERTRRGKLHRMRQGELVTGRRTFGYRYLARTADVPAHLETVPEEAEVVRQIFRWFTGEHLSLRQVAQRLNEAGITTTRDRHWHGSGVGQLLSNPAYTGTGYANKVEAVLPREKPLSPVYRKYPKTGKRLRPREEWLPFACPGIIAEETFELARQRLQDNRRLASRRTCNEYLLRGLIVCASCGKHMTANNQVKRYFCPYTQRARAAQFGLARCDNRTAIPVAELDALVWREVGKLVTRPAVLRRQYQRLAGKPVPQAAGSATALEAKAAKLREQLQRTNSLYIRGMLSEEQHRQKYRELKDQLHRTDSQLTSSRRDSLQEEEIEQMLHSFASFSRTIGEQLDTPDFQTRRAVTEQLVKCVTVSEKDVTVEYAAPLKRNTLCTVNHQ